MMNCFLGVDMGGTNLRFGLVNEKGKLVWSSRVATQSGSSQDQILKAMKQGIQEGRSEARGKEGSLKGIGIGVPGCVDFEKGFIHTLVNVPGWDNMPLAKVIADEFQLPTFVDNDVNVMALGELLFGAALGARNVICITLGTGVGGGIILEGQLYRGSSFTAGEIGHIVIEKDGPPCNCGNRGCLERYIGNRYLVERAIELYRQKSDLKVSENLTPEFLTHAAGRGDKIAQSLWREVAGHLGMVLAGLVNFFNPDLIVIGGGVAEAGKFLFEPLEKVVRERSMEVPGTHVRIKAAQLGVDAGLIGAAALVLQHTRTSAHRHIGTSAQT